MWWGWLRRRHQARLSDGHPRAARLSARKGSRQKKGFRGSAFELHRIVIDFLYPLHPLQLEPCPPQLIDASRHVKTWNRRHNSGCCRRATTKRLRSRRRVFAATNEQKHEEKREVASAPQSHGLSQMPGADMASRSNAQTFQKCYLKEEKM